MMKSIESMVIPILGSTALKYLIIYPLALLLMEKFFVFMADLVHKSKLLIKSEQLIEKFKFHMKDHSVI